MRYNYRHGMSQAKHDWVVIICLFGMSFFMLTTVVTLADNYVLRGHQCKEGSSNDGTHQGNTSQGYANPTSEGQAK